MSRIINTMPCDGESDLASEIQRYIQDRNNWCIICHTDPDSAPCIWSRDIRMILKTPTYYLASAVNVEIITELIYEEAKKKFYYFVGELFRSNFNAPSLYHDGHKLFTFEFPKDEEWGFPIHLEEMKSFKQFPFQYQLRLVMEHDGYELIPTAGVFPNYSAPTLRYWTHSRKTSDVVRQMTSRFHA